MPKIKRPLKPGSETNLAGASSDPSSPAQGAGSASGPTAPKDMDYIDPYMDRVDFLRRAVWLERKDGSSHFVFGLNSLLPRGLWLRLISYSLLAYFEGDRDACLELLDGADHLMLRWDETYGEEDEGPWITVYTQDGFVGYERFVEFFDGWEAESLRWLIPELGISPRTLKSALKRLIPAD